jgi:aconitase A
LTLEKLPTLAVHNLNPYGSRRGNHEVMMRGTFSWFSLDTEPRIEKRRAEVGHAACSASFWCKGLQNIRFLS